MTKRFWMCIGLLALVFCATSCAKSTDANPADNSSPPTNKADGSAAEGGTPPAGQPNNVGDSTAPGSPSAAKGEELQVNPNAGNFKTGEKT